jgi:hypothetical protein
LATSDRLERTKQTINEAEFTAKHVLVELESQRGQFKDMKDVVHETHSSTFQVNEYLKIIRDRTLRRKTCLWSMIVVLVVTDIFLFYWFFIKQ